MGPSVSHKLTDVWLTITDVSLVDEDTNRSLADDTNKASPGNLEMQVRKSYLVRKSYQVRKKWSSEKKFV